MFGQSGMVDVPALLSERHCLLSAQSHLDCQDSGLGFAFLRVLRFLKVGRLVRFLKNMPLLQRQIVNLLHVAGKIVGLCGLLAIFFSVFAILGFAHYCAYHCIHPLIIETCMILNPMT